MGLDWMPRDDELKDHGVGGEHERTGTARSAAAVGVGARTSET